MRCPGGSKGSAELISASLSKGSIVGNRFQGPLLLKFLLRYGKSDESGSIFEMKLESCEKKEHHG